MKKANKILGLLLLSVILVLSACSKDASKEKEEPKDADKQIEENQVDKDDDKEVVEEDENEDTESETTKDASDNEIMNPEIASETDGDVEVIFTNNDPDYYNDLDGLEVTIHKYQLVKVTDMNQSQDIQFNEDLEGYAVTADVTVKNTRNKDVHYNYGMRIQMEDKFDYLPSTAHKYIPEEKKLTFDTEKTNMFLAGTEKNFFLTFVMTNEQYEKLQKNDPKFIIEAGASENEDYTNSFGSEAVFDFAISKDQAEKAASAPTFYQDKLTTDNIAKKELIFEDLEINKTEELYDYKLTVEGVQYTEITPNESSKDRFRNFGDDELVALSVKLSVDNQSDEMVYNDSYSATLFVDDGDARILSQGMLGAYDERKLEPGNKGEHILVYIMQKKYFDIYEKFEIEFGPFLGEDGYVFKEKRMNFELPSK
ncbi:DUF5068 domain-containing protein [Virgibacillus soli]|uniref:DUF5068 domain-containing protein n=1 Tax=Paracerasibacillus soli TaxID=480284 RepID=UPI0035EC2795